MKKILISFIKETNSTFSFQISAVCVVVATVEAAPQQFFHPSQFANFNLDSNELYSPYSPHRSCPHGLKRINGICLTPGRLTTQRRTPKISKNIYLYQAPTARGIPKHINPAKLPQPKVHYNFVFIKTPNLINGGLKPLVVPPPKQKTLVYLLSKKPEAAAQEIIEVPQEPSQPEVFFVSYNEGDNPTLPGGIDLQTALKESAHLGNSIGGGESILDYVTEDLTGIRGY